MRQNSFGKTFTTPRVFYPVFYVVPKGDTPVLYVYWWCDPVMHYVEAFIGLHKEAAKEINEP